MITLENAYLKIALASKGAELQRIWHKQNELDYLWSGDPKYWGKYSPILFPIVGSLKEDTYFYKNMAYQLPRHGFARELEFLKEQLSATQAQFTLGHDAQTLAVYPFAFSLQVLYTLDENQLTCTYKVSNPGYDELLFSIGAHPAFAVPLLPETQYSDYYLQFNITENLHRWKLQNGLVDDHAVPVPTENGQLKLSPELFYEDAIVLKHLQSTSIELRAAEQERGLRFEWKDFPFFGIWAAKDAPFVCLEPWCGIADSVHHNQQLTNKEGIITLQPNEHWERSWSVTCY